MTRQDAVVLITAALIANPERYKYIAYEMTENGMSQNEATEKNVHKAQLIVDEIEIREGQFPTVEGDRPTEKKEHPF